MYSASSARYFVIGKSQRVTQVWRFTYRVGTTSRTTFAQQEAGKLHLGQREGRPAPLTPSADNKICDSSSSSSLVLG